jgi:aryl-alcohol dehydrogenase-like predicted oxidoreductase
VNYIHISGIDLQMSVLCLGVPEIGVRQTETEAHQLLDFWFQSGGNFIDTARVYSDWIPGEKQRSERILGDWLKVTGLRKQMVLGTKGGHPAFEDISRSRLSSRELRDDLEASLDKLGTDYIDLWWLHRDDERISVEEIVDTCDLFVREGRVKALGVANWTAARTRKASNYASVSGKAGFVATQLFWNLGSHHYRGLDTTIRSMDEDSEHLHQNGNLVAMPFSSQAGGFFTNWLEGGNVARKQAEKSGYATKGNFQIAKLAGEIARRNGVMVGSVVLAFLRAHPFSVVPIIGCSTPDHLAASIKALDFALPEADWNSLRELTRLKKGWLNNLLWSGR